MFQVGDLVFCPMRGCGTVEAIEERSMLDQIQEYFIIQLNSSSMTIMVPTDRVRTSRFRHISDVSTADAVLSILGNKNVILDTAIPPKQRFKHYQAKLISGSLEEYGEVIRDLTYIQKGKSLNSGERSILMDAKKLLLDEISTIKQISKEQAHSMLNKLLA